jgi:hypothetical protein
MGALNPNTLFVGLAFLVGVWFALLAILWRRLIARHPQKYESMGRPHFFSPLGAISTLRLLLTREHRRLGDRVLVVTADLALVVLVLYLSGLALLASIARFQST